MNILWAPWRRPYIEKTTEALACIFCQKPLEGKDRENLVLFRGRTCFIVLNLFPYNNGHLMIAPYRHVGSLTLLDEEEMVEMLHLAGRSEEILHGSLAAEGFNLGMNIGRVAGAGIPDHLHLHLVPRWSGDTNFLPVLGNTKVISEDLQSTYGRLRPLFEGLPASNLRWGIGGGQDVG